MRIALASKKFVNQDIQGNILTMKKTMNEAKMNQTQMVCFGEAFLQGFDALSWQYDSDKKRALTVSSSPIKQLQQYAKEIGICLAFGYIENDNDLLYCSYLVIDEKGEIIYNYKRISTGWKEPIADEQYYREGSEFSTFKYNNMRFTVGLCGDFWYEENVLKNKALKKDVILWPLYVNFSIQDFEMNHKDAYKEVAKQLGGKVLFINSLSASPDAFGGCIVFDKGMITDELPFGNEGLLYVEV